MVRFWCRMARLWGQQSRCDFTQSYIEALAGVAAIGSRLRVLKSGGATISVPAIKLNQFRFTSATR